MASQRRAASYRCTITDATSESPLGQGTIRAYRTGAVNKVTLTPYARFASVKPDYLEKLFLLTADCCVPVKE